MRELSLYVSASPEMDPECELLGQVLAQLTPSVRWQIKRTPPAHDKMDPDWAALESADFYVLLVGRDITAPIGVEYVAAREHGIRAFSYRNRAATPSPALSAFVRQLHTDWRLYDTPQAFASDLRKQLVRSLIEGTPGYGLSLQEIERLAAELRAEDEDEHGGTEDLRGAGRGGVILPNTPV
ncbi:MAG: hypothetical protein GX421_11325 [Caldisericales bacterium]|nr:hypothetical protein [Caldisericales bacterium]